MANKEVWISVLIVVVLLALGVFLTQKTTWFESSYNSSDFNEFDEFGDGGMIDVPSASECVLDSDCVADSCCHSISCVSKDKMPNCSGAICTMDCRPGTLDCGQGSCLCDKGKCAVKMGS